MRQSFQTNLQNKNNLHLKRDSQYSNAPYKLNNNLKPNATIKKDTIVSLKSFSNKENQICNQISNNVSPRNISFASSFSDLKKEQNNSNQKIKISFEKNCSNHEQRKATFYVQQQNPNHFYFYCSQCALNLSKAGFTIRQYSKNKNPYECSLIQLGQINQNLQYFDYSAQMTNNLREIQQMIDKKQKQYSLAIQSLIKIKQNEIMELQITRIKIIESMSQQQSKIHSIQRKISYLITDLSKQGKSTRISYDKSKEADHFELLYSKSIEKIKKQFEIVSNFMYTPVKIYQNQNVYKINELIRSLYEQKGRGKKRNNSEEQSFNQLANYIGHSCQQKLRLSKNNIYRRVRHGSSLPHLSIMEGQQNIMINV